MGPNEQPGPLSEAQVLVRSLAALGTARAALDAVAVRRLAALDRACTLDPETSPLRAGGYRDLGSLLADLWKTSLPHARQFCAVARATAPRHTLQGEALPAEFPDLARAVLGDDPDSFGAANCAADDDLSDSTGDSGPEIPSQSRVSVEQAAVIVRELVKTGPGCTFDERAAGERLLIDYAPGLTVGQLRRLAVQVRDRLDEDGTEPREQVLRRRRSLVVTTRDGMTHIDWWLDAESAGHVLPQITAYVTRDLRDPARTSTEHRRLG